MLTSFVNLTKAYEGGGSQRLIRFFDVALDLLKIDVAMAFIRALGRAKCLLFGAYFWYIIIR